MLPEKQATAFAAFQEVARHNAVFDPRITILFHLAAAMGVGRVPGSLAGAGGERAVAGPGEEGPDEN